MFRLKCTRPATLSFTHLWVQCTFPFPKYKEKRNAAGPVKKVEQFRTITSSIGCKEFNWICKVPYTILNLISCSFEPSSALIIVPSPSAILGRLALRGEGAVTRPDQRQSARERASNALIAFSFWAARFAIQPSPSAAPPRPRPPNSNINASLQSKTTKYWILQPLHFFHSTSKFTRHTMQYSHHPRIESLKPKITQMPKYHIKQPDRPVLERTGSSPVRLKARLHTRERWRKRERGGRRRRTTD